MAFPTGGQRFGPENATLLVRTGRTGAAAKAGHDLVLEVTSWTAVLDVADGTPAQIELDADGGSLRVREGTGGMQKLDDDDKASIEQTIDEEVLKRERVVFRSTAIAAREGGFRVDGQLTLLGSTRPLAADVTADGDGALTGRAVVKQSEWGLAPYSALFGALKVADEVHVELKARA